MTRPYWLANHVHLSVVEDDYVFLDLKKDKYFTLGFHEAAGFDRSIVGWPRIVEHEDTASTTVAASTSNSHIEKLVESGMLTLDSGGGRAADTVTVRMPSDALEGRDLDVRHPVGPACLAKFAVASLRTITMSRWRSIESIVNRVQRRKRLKALRGHEPVLSRLRPPVVTFDTLRPFYPATYVCLLDSILLIEFLALYGIYPDWVFGVRTKPWGAHCWIQSSGFVLNDVPDRVQHYTPIMVV